MRLAGSSLGEDGADGGGVVKARGERRAANCRSVFSSPLSSRARSDRSPSASNVFLRVADIRLEGRLESSREPRIGGGLAAEKESLSSCVVFAPKFAGELSLCVAATPVISPQAGMTIPCLSSSASCSLGVARVFDLLRGDLSLSFWPWLPSSIVFVRSASEKRCFASARNVCRFFAAFCVPDLPLPSALLLPSPFSAFASPPPEDAFGSSTCESSYISWLLISLASKNSLWMASLGTKSS
mmetsp:Transcript_16208/g.63205  ORF Transcript_16208/g.63205 Transcript_16208/m.63205 type:complete len:241 (-) Transcript_16208:2606-3328(-)